MKKIPTLFTRDPDRRFVTGTVTPGCEWVLEGGGVATVKWDGTSILIATEGVFARRAVKPGAEPPDGYVEVEVDPGTGKSFGWEPIEQSSFTKIFDEAVAARPPSAGGTYELCGPKVNGNPQGLTDHELIPHGARWAEGVPRVFSELGYFLADFPYEGIVWWNGDGRMAKIKRRDFGHPWPLEESCRVCGCPTDDWPLEES